MITDERLAEIERDVGPAVGNAEVIYMARELQQRREADRKLRLLVKKQQDEPEAGPIPFGTDMRLFEQALRHIIQLHNAIGPMPEEG